jgi:hypothetical protein
MAGSCTVPLSKRTAAASPPHCAAANAASRSRSWRAASCAALPFRSLPVDAAVAEVLATFCVSVAVTRTCAKGMPSSCATTWATLVFRPWPISVPPWFTSTEPSV